MKEFVNESKINPEHASLLEASLNLVPDKNGLYKEAETGELFIEIASHPEKQRFVSSLLKGIINSAEIVHVNGKYFSHVQQFDNLDPKSTEDFKAEIDADTFILSKVFGDTDHKFYVDDDELNSERTPYGINARPRDIVAGEHKNLVVDDDNSKKYFFDFGEAFWNSYATYQMDWFTSEEGRTGFRNYILKELINDRYISDNTEKVFEIIYRKAEELNSRLDSKDFFNAIMDKSQLDLKKEFGVFMHQEDPNSVLFDQIKNRCEIILKALQELKLKTQKIG